MRLPVILAALVMAAGGLAGCFGSETEPTDPASIDGQNPLPGTGGTGTSEEIRVLAALRSTLTTTAAAWVQTGTAVDVSAAPPTMAKGDVTYTWAIGAMPGTTPIEAKADTGSKDPADWIQPGGSASVIYSESGVFRMHCHPHPDMRHNVTVIDGYTGPGEVEVVIIDGAKPNEYRFVPEEIVVGVGTTVTYVNKGEQPHTATALAQEPPLKLVALEEATGSVTVDGEGWQRILVVMQDGDGRIGSAEHHIYATSTLPAFETKTFTFDFNVGGPDEIDPVESPQSQTFKLDLGGKLYVNYTAVDAAGGASGDANLAEAELHVVKQGETQDTLTGDPSPGENLVTTAGDGTYTLTVKATQGVQPSVTVVVEVVYDFVPPPMSMDAPADDGHGGHAH